MKTPSKQAGGAFRGLRVWQEAALLARDVNVLAEALSPGYGYLADQLRRAASSVALNIAEGNGKRSRREYLRFLDIAAGSLCETECAVELARLSALAPESALGAVARRVKHTGRLLTALINAMR